MWIKQEISNNFLRKLEVFISNAPKVDLCYDFFKFSLDTCLDIINFKKLLLISFSYIFAYTKFFKTYIINATLYNYGFIIYLWVESVDKIARYSLYYTQDINSSSMSSTHVWRAIKKYSQNAKFLHIFMVHTNTKFPIFPYIFYLVDPWSVMFRNLNLDILNRYYQ